MTYANKTTVNFAGGEIAPGVIARTDLPLANKVSQRIENYIVEPYGPLRYRQGTRYVHHTRNHNYATFIEFQFSDRQSYLIEATEGYFRFYRNEALILNGTPLTITGVTKANPGVVTYTGTDPVAGQEVYIEGIVGMTELNGKFFTLGTVDGGANTFQLKDSFGNNVNTSSYTTYGSAGTASVVYEIKTPYLEEDLPELIGYAQNADTMYIDHRNYEPRKLTRSGHANWTLTRYSRTADQFATDNVTFGVITAVTAASPGVVSDASHTFVTGDHVYVSGIVGMVELNDRHFLIGTTGAGTYQLKDYDTGVVVNTSAYTAYSSGGITELIAPTRTACQKYPGAVGFTDDGRVGHFGSEASPETNWYSKGPSAAGAVQFDDFTTGSNPSDAIYFTLAPLKGKVDSIRWMTNTDKYIALGTYGSIRRVFGATEQASIAPDEITAKGANSDGVKTSRPVLDGSVLFYIARSGLALEAIEYDYQIDGYNPDDKNLISDHLTAPGLAQIARQVGRPTVIWAVRNDGVLLGLTYKGKENIAAWHRHYIGGNGIVERIGIMPRDSNQEQLWMIVKRTVNGNTVRYIEFFTDAPMFPTLLDFYTGIDNKANDLERFLNYQSEVAKQAIHVDSSLTYDGSAYGTDAAASITLGADADIEEAEDIVVTASAAVFTSDMVGREIWGAYTSEGIGGGRLEITHYTSTTQVEGTIIDTFPATATYDAGDWFLTATTVSGLDHLEGETVSLITDGAVPDQETVENGSVSITLPASVIHVGMPYAGVFHSIPLDQGGTSGPAQNKPKIVTKVATRFLNAGGVQFGTSPYRLTRVEFRAGNDFTGRPVPLFTGVDSSFYEDETEEDKTLYIIQDEPLPCTIVALDIYTETADE